MLCCVSLDNCRTDTVEWVWSMPFNCTVCPVHPQVHFNYRNIPVYHLCLYHPVQSSMHVLLYVSTKPHSTTNHPSSRDRLITCYHPHLYPHQVQTGGMGTLNLPMGIRTGWGYPLPVRTRWVYPLPHQDWIGVPPSQGLDGGTSPSGRLGDRAAMRGAVQEDLLVSLCFAFFQMKWNEMSVSQPSCKKQPEQQLHPKHLPSSILPKGCLVLLKFWRIIVWAVYANVITSIVFCDQTQRGACSGGSKGALPACAPSADQNFFNFIGFLEIFINILCKCPWLGVGTSS